METPMTVLIRSGKIQDFSPPSLPWTDPAIQYGSAGFFETMRYESGRIKRFPTHKARLQRTLSHWRIEPPCSDETLNEAIRLELAQNADTPTLRVKFMVGQDPAREPTGRPAGNATLPSRAWIHASPIDSEYLKPLSERGASRLGVFRDYPISTTHPLTGFKSSQYGLYREARRRMIERGWDEGILLNERGEVVEACHFNIFWIKGKHIFTPDQKAGCLPGVMAATLQRASNSLGAPVESRLCALKEVLGADCVFLTSSVAEVIAVQEIEGTIFNEAKSNSLFMKIIAALED